MPLKSLDFLADKVAFETLPPNWNTFDLGQFSPSKRLWKYQREALQSALSILFKYYEAFEDYRPGDDGGADAIRRQKMREWYEDSMHLSTRERKTLNLSLTRTRFNLRQLLADYYAFDEDNPVIDFEEVCNRMSFWMATGSGKTIILVKLLELLHTLMQREEIPVCDVLFLTHREDLLGQFRATVDEFNSTPGAPVHIELKELRDYPEAKRETPGGLLGRDHTLRVFYYRSDNLSDEHKQAIVDFRNYDNHGRWYVVLDEAHKGTAEDAKRKHLVNILTRAGFLFNFSATFTDPIDLATTVHNFNLSEFIGKGYGKHIAILKQELAAFRERANEDYTDEEKRKVVVKSMLLLAYTAQKVRKIRKLSGDVGLYHHPMLLTLVNSVNTEDADLKLYFEQILAIGRGRVEAKTWEQAKAELWEELKEEPELLYEDGRKTQIAEKDITNLGPADVWREVYNFKSSKGGDMEVLVRPGNRKEIAFKMKTSERPFALIKIGDISGWMKEELTGFDTIETLEDESFFDGLNDPSSSINILMGSRTFYEGWDSNRPNVINFVNIGTGNNAKKFIMQSVGRGVRVQSWKGKRQRLEELHDDFDDLTRFRKLKAAAMPPETLYVLGTNREALRIVLEALRKEKPQREGLLKLKLNPDAKKRLLLIPEYREAGRPLIEEREPSKFEMADEDIGLLEAYGNTVPSDPVLLLRHGSSPKRLKHFRASLAKPDKYYVRHANRTYRNMGVMVGRVMDYFGIRAKELEGLRKLDTEKDIVHFRHMNVDKEHAEELQRKIDRVLYSKTDAGKKEAGKVFREVEQMELDYSERSQEITRLMHERELTESTTYNDDVAIEYLSNHYYNPAIFRIGRGRRIDYLKHIIDVDSEVRFLKELKKYVKEKEENCVLKKLDWWMFSKLDEHTDTPFIPYYNPLRNRPAEFIPDFVFWGQKGEDYTILFVDPKGMENQNWERKADGYIRLFEEDGVARNFEMEGVRVSVRLSFFTRDRNHASEGGYQRFWMDNAKELFASSFP